MHILPQRRLNAYKESNLRLLRKIITWIYSIVRIKDI
mgnify:CR=1 FL=1